MYLLSLHNRAINQNKFMKGYIMRTKLIYENSENHAGYGAGSGDTERYEYESVGISKKEFKLSIIDAVLEALRYKYQHAKG